VLIRPIVLSAALCSAACFASIPAHAQTTGFYAGGAVGRLDYNIDTASFSTNSTRITSKDEQHTGWKVFGGYQFNNYIGVEASYVDLGKFQIGGTTSGVPFTAKADTNGFGLALVGTLPLNNKVAFFGKMGGFRSKSKATGSVGNIKIADSGHDNGSLVGAGVRYNFTPQFALRVEAERFGLGDGDSAMFYSLGAQYRF
jgi:OOP family OmpA-OmpF porin